MMFRLALAFFTRVPVGSLKQSSSLQGMVVWLPAVGLVIGSFVALSMSFAATILPASLCGLIGCLAWVAITGGLHLDGVVDCGDGLMVEAPPSRRLEIMKDPCLGTFGGIALFFVLAFKGASLTILSKAFFTNESWWIASFTLIIACCLAAILSRAMLCLAMRKPSARPDGLGEAVHKGLTPQHERRVLAAVLAICLFAECFGLNGFIALAASLLTTYAVLAVAMKQIGGVTGDVFGCIVELNECAILLVLCANLGNKLA